MSRRDLKAARMKPGYCIRPEEVVEPGMSAQDWEDFERGVSLFNQAEFWESHEAWEMVWRRHPEPSRIFFQGLIQLAAAYHQLRRGIFHGVVKHLNNSGLKLEPFPDPFLGVSVEALRAVIRAGKEEADRLGEDGLDRFNPRFVGQVCFKRPPG